MFKKTVSITHILAVILCLFLALAFLGTDSVSAQDWQEKNLLIPRGEPELIEHFDLLDFSVEFVREDRTQTSIFTFEYLGEELIEGDDLDKFEMSMRREGEEGRPFYAWFDSDYNPRRAELDGDETAPESIYMYLEPILNPFFRLAELGIEDISEMEFEYGGERTAVLAGEEFNVHSLTVPGDELEGDVSEDLVLELAEFENHLAVVYYNYMHRDAETVEIEYQAENLRLQGD